MSVTDTALAPSGARRDTGIGFLAVLLWALLATLTALTGAVPPLLLTALSFSVAAVIGLCWIAATDGAAGVRAMIQQPLSAWVVGVGGLFGYHALYFTALRLAPPVEASLIAYLWPLLIVLFSALLPGERLRTVHIVGALLGFAGAALLITGGGGAVGFQAFYVWGYLAALAAALVWSSYSVLLRSMRSVPTQAVAGYCLATGILSLGLHLLIEDTAWPANATQWLAVLGLGLGPVGGAFYLWDWGCKRGDIRLLGIASYSAPVLSTLVLIALGLAAFTAGVAMACLLVTLGAVVASRAPAKT